MTQRFAKARSHERQGDVDMTQGGIIRHLALFALPLLAGNLFQQLYNMVDTWVVGNFVSNEAFSAVGTVTPICNLLIGTFLGLSSGAGVVISQFYGAKQYDKVQETVHTIVTLTLLLGAVFTAVGILMTPAMLHLMNTPENVFPESRTYLTVYFGGIIGLMLYNMGAGILRAVGDSRRAFYFLVVATMLNIVLDLTFVLLLGMGVEGVALATVLSQLISALLCLATLMRSDSCIRLEPKKLRIHKDVLMKVLIVGIPSSVQMAVTSFSNVFVQSYINHFGADCMSGWTAYAKVDQLMFLPLQSVALSATTFVGQNLGSGQEARAKKGVRAALGMAVTATILLMIPVLIFAPWLVAFFNSKAEVVQYGTLMLRCISPFYVLCCFNQIYSSALRGAGNSKMPMIIMLSSFVVFRQIYLFIVANFIANETIPIVLSYPAGWFVCSLLMSLYYHRADLSGSRLVEDGAVAA